MKRLTTLLMFSFGIFFFGNISYSQKINPSNYDKFIQEVYGETQYAGQNYKSGYIKKFEAVEVLPWDNKAYPFLSAVPLKDKYNPGLTYDAGANFNPENFNPLKYFFDFYGKNIKTYRVEGTNYMIRVTPITNN